MHPVLQLLFFFSFKNAAYFGYLRKSDLPCMLGSLLFVTKSCRNRHKQLTLQEKMQSFLSFIKRN